MNDIARAFLVSCLLVASACATSAGGGDDDAGEDAARDVNEDTAEDASDAVPDGSGQDATDATDADGSGDTVGDATADATPDGSGDDVFPDDCETTGDECEPFSVACDGNAVVFCSRCGFELRRETCEDDQICEFSEGAGRCRDCVGDECPEVVDCVANTRSCFDFNSQLICGPDGRVQSIGDCPAGRRCIGGVCQQSGAATGETCTVNSDPNDGCAGQLCLCGPDDRVTNGDALCGPFPDGYCTTVDCSANGCAPDDEVCVDFRAAGEPRDPFCVLTEGCDERGAVCGPSFRCNELPTPTGDGIAWDWGCWPPVATIGEACTSDRDCLGGECRTGNVGGTNVSYCVAPCGEGVGCPSHASCVTDPEGGSGFVCLANGNATDCPRTETQRLLIDRTAPRMVFGGGSASVCYFAN